MTRNLADNQRRSDVRRRQREESRAHPETPADAPTDPLEMVEALAAVEGLPDDLREVLVARIWGGPSLEEVARLCRHALGIAAGIS